MIGIRHQKRKDCLKMAFDGITVAALVQELKHTLTDGRINKIAQPETDELLLTIKTADGMKRLSISASASREFDSYLNIKVL